MLKLSEKYVTIFLDESQAERVLMPHFLRFFFVLALRTGIQHAGVQPSVDGFGNTVYGGKVATVLLQPSRYLRVCVGRCSAEC